MAVPHIHSEATAAIKRRIVAPTSDRPAALPGKILMPDGRSWHDFTRVIVLVPREGLRVDRLVSALSALQMPDQTEIVLAAKGTYAEVSRTKHRSLNALLAHLRDTYPVTYGQMTTDAGWQDALQGFVKRRDLLVCLAEQSASAGIFRREPLSQVLLRALQLPVFEISGAYPPLADRLIPIIKRLLLNLCPFAIVGIFFWFQIKLGSQTSGWVQTAALIVTVIVELALIFVWSLFLD